MRLVHEKTGIDADNGETITDFRGATAILVGGTPPHKPSSTGKVLVRVTPDATFDREFYPSVFGLKWVE